MRGCRWNEEKIRAALDTAAYSYDPPTDLKQQIDAQLARREKKEVITMKRMSVKKVAIATAAACVLMGTACMAAGRITSYEVTMDSDTATTDFADVAKLEKQTGVTANAKETFDNGYVFSEACVISIAGMDDEGNVAESADELDISYKLGEKMLTYAVKNGADQFTEEELAEADIIYSGVDETYQMTASYDLYWSADGQGFRLSGTDLDMTGEELAAMAAELN